MKISLYIKTFWRKLQRWWHSYHWMVIIAIAIIALVLGFVGFRKYFNALSESRSPFDILYLSLQLFTLESGSVVGSVSWELEIARLLAPTIAAYAVIKALVLIFREKIQLLRMRFIRDHAVICGLGRKGTLLAQKLCERQEKVVVIELDEGNDFLAQSRDQGAIVFVGDATDPVMLKKARVHKAKYLISVCGDDGVNAEVAVHAREFVKNRKRKMLTCIVHIVDPELCLLLKEQEIETGKIDAFRLEFFNIFDSGARSWLKEYIPFSEAEDPSSCRPHLLIIGVGRMGESLVVHTAKKWKALYPETSEKLRITMIDKIAEEKRESLCLRYPKLEKICTIIPLQMNIKSPDFQRAEYLFDSNKKCDVTGVYVCLDNDSFGLSTALILHQRIRDHKIPIVVRMISDAGLATLLLEENACRESSPQIHAFGLLDRTCQPDLLLGGTYEILARAIHEGYLQRQRETGETHGDRFTLVSWDELPEHFKETTRLQADHIGEKLKAIGCGIAPLNDWDAELFMFTPEEVELMARMEHECWCEERRLQGWSYAPGPKNIKKKKSPHLVPWEELPEEIKNHNRSLILYIPSLLAKAGFQIYRRIKHT